MAQHDMNIANQGFPATRADINNALQALASNNSGTSAPSTTFANQWWYDTTNNKLYIRNEANNAWIEFAVLDQTNNEWQITTGVIKAKDSDGLVLQTDDGTARISIADSGNVTINDGSGNADFRVESDGNTHMLFVDANEECVSVGTSSTSVSALNVFSSGANTAAIAARGNGSANGMTLFGDLYTDDENQITLGVGYANANAVLARGCKPHNSQSNAFLSSQDTYATRPAALSIQDGGLTFKSTTSSAATTTNSAVTLYNYFEMDTTETVFNEDSLNRDFRVETDASAYGFSVDAGTGYLAARGGSQVRFTLGSTGTSGGNNANWIRGESGNIGLNAASGNIHFEIAGTERMRVDGGDVLFGCTSLPSSSVGGAGFEDASSNRMILKLATTTTGSTNLALIYNPNGSVGSITTSGSSTSFNTSSDYRLKENVVYDWDATTRLKQLKPARFNFIADADTTVDGFLAHEAQTVVPEAVTGTHNEVDDDGNPVMQGIDQAKLVPLLVKTIQELEARITELENA